MYRLRLFVLTACLLSIFFSCENEAEPQGPTAMDVFSASFPLISLPDTLFLGGEVNKGKDSVLALKDVLAVIDEAMLMESNSYFDTMVTTFHAFYRFELDTDLEAYYMGQSDSWILHNSLFLYSKSQQKFVKSYAVAGIDGGDGGQQLLDSWVLDWNADGKKDLLTRIHDQWITMDPDAGDVVQHVHDSCVVNVKFAGADEVKGLDKLPAFLDRYPVNW